VRNAAGTSRSVPRRSSADDDRASRLLLGHRGEGVLVLLAWRVRLCTQLIHQVGCVLLVDLDDARTRRLRPFISRRIGEVRGGLLELLGGRPLPFLLSGPVVTLGRPREQVSLVVAGLLQLRGAGEGLLGVLDGFLVSGGCPERLVDGLERCRVVPITLVFFIVVVGCV
jgi:hypothetical protein